MVYTNSKVLIENTADCNKKGWLDLPFSEDEFEEFLEGIGVNLNDDDDEEGYDRLMAGKEINKWKVVGYESDYLMGEHFADLYEASDLVERIENLKDWEAKILDALVEDGESLEEAIEKVEDGDADYWPNTDLSELARQFVDEGLYDTKYLLNFIDFEALGKELEVDGYTEVNGGVLRRP